MLSFSLFFAHFLDLAALHTGKHLTRPRAQAAPAPDAAAPAPAAEKKADAPKAADAPADAPKPKKKKVPRSGSSCVIVSVAFVCCFPSHTCTHTVSSFPFVPRVCAPPHSHLRLPRPSCLLCSTTHRSQLLARRLPLRPTLPPPPLLRRRRPTHQRLLTRPRMLPSPRRRRFVTEASLAKHCLLAFFAFLALLHHRARPQINLTCSLAGRPGARRCRSRPGRRTQGC